MLKIDYILCQSVDLSKYTYSDLERLKPLLMEDAQKIIFDESLDLEKREELKNYLAFNKLDDKISLEFVYIMTFALLKKIKYAQKTRNNETFEKVSKYSVSKLLLFNGVKRSS